MNKTNDLFYSELWTEDIGYSVYVDESPTSSVIVFHGLSKKNAEDFVDRLNKATHRWLEEVHEL